MELLLLGGLGLLGIIGAIFSEAIAELVSYLFAELLGELIYSLFGMPGLVALTAVILGWASTRWVPSPLLVPSWAYVAVSVLGLLWALYGLSSTQRFRGGVRLCALYTLLSVFFFGLSRLLIYSLT